MKEDRFEELVKRTLLLAWQIRQQPRPYDRPTQVIDAILEPLRAFGTVSWSVELDSHVFEMKYAQKITINKNGSSASSMYATGDTDGTAEMVVVERDPGSSSR